MNGPSLPGPQPGVSQLAASDRYGRKAHLGGKDL